MMKIKSARWYYTQQGFPVLEVQTEKLRLQISHMEQKMAVVDAGAVFVGSHTGLNTSAVIDGQRIELPGHTDDEAVNKLASDYFNAVRDDTFEPKQVL